MNDLFEKILRSLPDYAALEAEARAREARVLEAQAEARRLAADVDEDELQADANLPEAEEEAPVELAEADIMPRFAPVYLPDDMEMSEVEYDREYGKLPLDESKSSNPMTVERVWESKDFEDDEAEAPQVLEQIQIAIVGRPNVGKSTLLNTLVGERRAITSPVAGTTRDSLDVEVRREGQKYIIVDTAGLRRKGKIDEGSIERFSALRSLGALSACDVAIVVLDASEGVSEQDEKIAGLAHEQGKGLVIAVNKWDLLEKDHKTVHAYTKKVRESFKFAPYAPIVFLSALSGRRVPRILDEAKKVAYERTKRAPTKKLNQVLERAVKQKALPMYRGRVVKLYYGVQVDSAPPRFALFFNYPKEVHFSYFRYLKNEIRESFGFEGTDIKLMARKR